MSELEDLMWFHLKAVGLDGLLVRHYAFHPTRRWEFDFAAVGSMIALEVEGGTWVQGRHSRGGKSFEGDCEKYNEAALLGWKVLRVTTDMVKDGRALQYVERAL